MLTTEADHGVERSECALTSEMITAQAAHTASEKKATDVEILDLRDLTVMTEYFVIASAETEVQVRAITEAIIDTLEEQGVPVKRREGLQDARWVLLDYGDAVIHIFRQQERELYDLERLWGDAPRLIADGNGADIRLVAAPE